MVTNTIEAFLILGIGFLGAQIVAHLVRRLLPIYGSVFFLTLGVVAGPLVSDVLSREVLAGAHLPISLLLAWVGLEVGLGLTVRRDGGLTDGAIRMGFIYGLVSLALLGGCSYGIAVWVAPELFSGETPGLVAAALAAAGLTGSPFVLRFVATRLGASGPVREAGESLIRVARVVAMLAFGIALAFPDRPTPEGFRPLAPAEWFLGELLVGLTIGLVADAFLGDEPDDPRLVLILIAVTLVSTGAGLHLGLSPLVVSLAVGLTLANFGQRAAPRHQVATALEQPTLALLLVFAGASILNLSSWELLTVAGGLLVIRLLTLGLAGVVAARSIDPDSATLRRLGLVGVGQGAPAIAIALTYTLAPASASNDTVLVIVLASVVLNDLWATPAARVVLDEAGEIPTLATEA